MVTSYDDKRIVEKMRMMQARKKLIMHTIVFKKAPN